MDAPYRDQDDERLVAALQEGANPEEIFQELFERYRGPIHGFLRRQGCQDEKCRDLAQEVFLRAFRSIKTFDGRAQVKTWVFTITRNVWLKEVRKQATEKRGAPEVSLEEREESRSARTASSTEPGPLQELLADERVRLLHEAVQKLPPRMRRVVILRIDQGLKYREIAAVMQISVDAVKSHYGEAKKRLGKHMGSYFDESDSTTDRGIT